MPSNPKAAEASEALRAACARSAELAPDFERLKAETESTVDAALELARTARRSKSGQMRAVQPPKTDLTGRFRSLK